MDSQLTDNVIFEFGWWSTRRRWFIWMENYKYLATLTTSLIMWEGRFYAVMHNFCEQTLTNTPQLALMKSTGPQPNWALHHHSSNLLFLITHHSNAGIWTQSLHLINYLKVTPTTSFAEQVLSLKHNVIVYLCF